MSPIPVLEKDGVLERRREPKKTRMRKAMMNPSQIIRELNNRSFYHFLKIFWEEVSQDPFEDNWHIECLCGELQQIAEQVGLRRPKLHDLLINIPPGTTKTTICSIMFPAWCWTRWYWMRFITLSYSAALSLESAEYSRDLIRSKRFQLIYPELSIKSDKDIKGNFRVVKSEVHKENRVPRQRVGGNRYSTSVGGTVTGFHGHIIIWDDPLNPHQAVSETELRGVNRWMDSTLPTRKVDKLNTPTIGIMQRLHENDPTGAWLSKKKTNLRHICLPGSLDGYEDKVKPPEFKQYYRNGLLDPRRLSVEALKELETDLGQYGYAGQVGQSPTPPKGGMFKVDQFQIVDHYPLPHEISDMVRYWDKAGTKEQAAGLRQGAYTVGVKMARLKVGKWIVLDVKRGRWSSDERERIIRATAEADGQEVKVYHEQEPGSGGKESAENTVRNLAGFHNQPDLPRGDKIFRADPWSVQVDWGNVWMMRAEWNAEFTDEHKYFPFSKYKDQVDAAGGAFAKLSGRREARAL